MQAVNDVVLVGAPQDANVIKLGKNGLALSNFRAGYIVGKVLSVGRKLEEPPCEVGDSVLFYAGDYMYEENLIEIDGQRCFVLRFCDIIAKDV